MPIDEEPREPERANLNFQVTGVWPMNRLQLESWTREGGPFDILAIGLAIVVIVGGAYIVNARSSEFRTAGIAAGPAPAVAQPASMPQ